MGESWASLEKAKGALEALESEDDADEEAVGGALVDALKGALKKFNISVQRYWNGQLVGPDCRRFIKHHKEILADIGNAVEAHGWSAAESQDLVARHCDVIEHLDVVGHYSRAVRTLTPSEIDELARACAKFGEA